jgi:hypothetical protein
VLFAIGATVVGIAFIVGMLIGLQVTSGEPWVPTPVKEVNTP